MAPHMIWNVVSISELSCCEYELFLSEAEPLILTALEAVVPIKRIH